MNISGYNPILNRPNPYSPTKSADSATGTFGSMMGKGATSSPAVTVSISAEARAALASSSVSSVQTWGSASSATTSPTSFIANFDTLYNNVDHTQAEFNAHYAEGARAISASQGLPEGQYDFTRMSPKEAFIVANDMIVNHDASDKIDGFLSMIQSDGNGPNSFSNTKMNFISGMQNYIDFASSSGYQDSARVTQRSLDYILGFDSKSRRTA